MKHTIKTGDSVKMNAAFLATLAADDRKNERRRRYTVTAVRQMGDTLLVDMVNQSVYGRNQRPTGCAAGWLEVTA